MKNILVYTIGFYQLVLSPILKGILGVRGFCRFYPSCSEYAKENIIQKGVIVGAYLSFIRLLSCQPFFRRVQ